MISRRLQIVLVVLVVTAVGLGYYALRLRRQAERAQTAASDTRPIAPPVSGQPESVHLFVADDQDGTIVDRQISLAVPASHSGRALALLRALTASYLESSSVHRLGEGADIRSVYFVSETLAVVDLNAEFANHHRSGGMVEELTIVSLVKTLSAAFPKLAQVRFLVDGKERETLAGHADLTSVYDVSSITELARELK
jgi:spore germination protein GerM